MAQQEESSYCSSEEGISEQEEEQVKPTQKEKSSSEEEEEESSSDGSPSAYKLQPIPKPPTIAAKRNHEEVNNTENSSKSSKKPKFEEKKYVSSTHNTGCITRMWSDDDEIAVLNGMIQFKNSKRVDADQGDLYDYIKGKLSVVDFSRDQLRWKVGRLKKKFFNGAKRGKNGSDPVFSKPHEAMAFEISKKIWGDEVGKYKGSRNSKVHQSKKDTVKAAKKIKFEEKDSVKDEKDGEEGVIWSKYPFFSGSFAKIGEKFPSLGLSDAVKYKLSLIGNAKAKELDDKWKQILVEETELHYKMLNLMSEQVKLGLEINEEVN